MKEDEDQSKHVMLSYSWHYQDLIFKIRDALKHSGYKVWIDVDNLGGSMLEGMALAVENSAVVLVAVSQKYKKVQIGDQVMNSFNHFQSCFYGGQRRL